MALENLQSTDETLFVAFRNRYFLMRHGESLANVADKIISSPHNGCAGFGLSSLGREQALLSARQSELGPETRVICSDFLRTRETAEIAAEALGCPPPSLDVRLRERFFGPWEGSSTANYHPVWLRDEQNPTDPGEGVETAAALTSRLTEVIASLEESSRDQCFLLVSHGDPLRFLQLWAWQRPLQAHQSLAHFTPAEIRELSPVGT